VLKTNKRKVYGGRGNDEELERKALEKEWQITQATHSETWRLREVSTADRQFGSLLPARKVLSLFIGRDGERGPSADQRGGYKSLLKEGLKGGELTDNSGGTIALSKLQKVSTYVRAYQSVGDL